jgi:threonine dehydratase
VSLPAIPTAEDIRDARAVLQPHLPLTRLIRAPALSRRLGAEILLKLDCELPTGSFKPRGAIYALTRKLRSGRVREAVASSTGNHGAAVAYAGRLLGVPATIFLPAVSNPVKRARIAELGARIVEIGEDLAAAADAAREHATKTGRYYLDDATDPHLPAGPATMAEEIFEQAPHTRTLFVPVGDSALLRGVAAVARMQPSRVRVIGVQAASAPSYYLSWRAGRPVTTERCDTIADGLATRTPQPDSVVAVNALVDDMVLVTEAALVEAVRWLLLEEHVVAEPSGAAAAAAALEYGASGTIVLPVTGANLTPAVLAMVAGAG